MNQLALLIPILLFFSFDPAHAARIVRFEGHAWWWGGGLFLAVPVITVAVARLAGGVVARRAWDPEAGLPARTPGGGGRGGSIWAREAFHVGVARFNRQLERARVALLLWTAVGLYFLNWDVATYHLLNPLGLAGAHLAVAAVVTLPSYLAWLGLLWAQYPADRAARESVAVQHLEDAVPVHAPPTLWQFLDHHLRNGPGRMLIPAVTILLVRDLAFWAATALGLIHAAGTLASTTQPGAAAEPAGAGWIEQALYFGSSVVVFLFLPWVFVRVLRTTPLPPGELRRKLERLSERAGVGVSDLRIWHTGNSAANAVVTGVLPGVRYVLLSDLLIETLTDEQVEAVYAHELGHIVHRHMLWYTLFLISFATVLGWLDPAAVWLFGWFGVPPDRFGPAESAGLVALGLVLLAFGLISRTFEHQADVFAARAMQPPPDATVSPSEQPHALHIPFAPPPALEVDAVPTYVANPPLKTDVGPRGAAAFASALERVAWVNNLPMDTRSLTHPSMRSRIATLRAIATAPQATTRFDRAMARTRAGILLIALGGAITVVGMKYL